jgi:hypothetical protein
MQLMSAYHRRNIGSIAANENYAVEHGKRALALLDPGTDVVLWATAQDELACIYVSGFTGVRTERIDDAISMLSDVVSALGNEIGSELWCKAMSNLGEAYATRPHGDRNIDLAKAEECFTKLADIETLEVNPAGWGQTQACLAGVRLKQFDPDGVLACLELAQEGHRRAGLDVSQNILMLFASAYKMKKDTQRQVFYLRKLLERRSRELVPVMWARVATELASALWPSDPQEASSLAHDAIEALEGNTFAARDRLQAFRLLARTSLTEDNPEGLLNAIGYLEAARDAIHGDLPDFYIATCYDLGGAYAQADRWADAAQAFESAVEALDRRYQMLLIFRSRAEDVSLTVSVRHHAAYALARCGRNEDALLMLESARARILGEALARDTADLEQVSSVDPDAYAAFLGAAEQVRAVELRGRDLAQDMSSVTYAERELDEAAREAYAALSAATDRISDLPGMRNFLAPPRIEDIAVQPRHVLVYLVSTRWGSLMLAASRVTHDAQLGISAQRVEGITDTDLRSALAIYPDAVTTSIPASRLIAAIDQIGDQFADVLNQAIRPSVERIILVPCGLLGVLPLHLVWTAPGATRRLIDELPVVQALFGRGLTSAHGADRPVEPFVVVANPRKDLQYTEDEVFAIKAGWTDMHLLAGSAASIAAVQSAARSAGCVHLACHGRQDPATPLASGLELADGKLTVAQLLAEHPPAFAASRLVVMSSCESAAVDPKAPDEVVGLPAAMTYAGAAAVVGSLWRIDDAAAAVFVVGFYARLRAYRRTIPAWAPADVCRDTQLWMRSVTASELLTSMQGISPELRAWLRLFSPSDMPFADPRHWAPFTVLGA